MSPWTILGWLFVAVIVVPFTAFAAAATVGLIKGLRERASSLLAHFRTRKICPAPGQIWRQGGSDLYITEIFENGRIGIRTSHPRSMIGAGWSDTPEAWRERVRNRRLYLTGEFR